MWRQAVLAEATSRGARCTLCPHYCRLQPGQAGVCKVRRGSAQGGIETSTFASSVIHEDAIERKPFFHFRPGTQTLTLAAPGCSFRCDYCVNFRISQFGRDDEAPWTAKPVDAEAIVARAAAAGSCLALSYTEPSLAPELTIELGRLGRDAGVELVWKSSGFMTRQAIELCAPAIAAVNIDVKGLDERTHRQLTGASPQPVVDAIRAFRELGVWVEVSTPLIPGVTEPRQIADVIAGISVDIPWHLLRFTPAYRMGEHPPTSPAALAAAADSGRASGLRYIYVERALGQEGRQTLCPCCHSVVIRRDIWSLQENRLRAGQCPDCGTLLEGRW
ncbi:MAG TPA: radical SAM protein [Streptosporangiaceae bacterium]|nr:radical SAM protein [Streptosporangiaceae bacterium]